jgi:hypothetical protein
MKIIERKYDEVDGNVAEDEEFDIEIDATKTNKMFGLLLESYKNPRAALIREYTSNAWDSQHEAGKDDIPVVVTIAEDEAGWYISIKDEGIGMSHEFFSKFFSKLLYSTKEDSNDAIGGFGIGSKTALAYTSSFHVETIKDSELNYYIIYKESSTKPRISRLLTEKTDSPNGVTVKVYLKNEYNEKDKFAEEVTKELCYFNNVILRFSARESLAMSYNNSKLIESDTFKLKTDNQYSDEMHLVLGKVAYPIDWKELGLKSFEYSVPVAIPFEIGELQVNMTRETIIYTDEAKLLIGERVQRAKKDLIDRFNKANKPIENIFEYLAAVKDGNGMGWSDTILKLPNTYNNISLYCFKDLLEFKSLRIAKSLGIENIDAESISLFITPLVRIKDGKILKTPPTIKDLNTSHTKIIVIKEKAFNSESKEFLKYIQDAIVVRMTKYRSFYGRPIWRKIEMNIPNNNTSKLIKIIPTQVGRAKRALGFKRAIIKQLYEIWGDNAIDYDTFSIPESWREEQKRIIRENRVKIQKAEGIISVKNIKHGTRYDLDLSKLNNYTGIIIYGFQQNKERLLLIREILGALTFNRRYIDRKEMFTYNRSDRNRRYSEPLYEIFQIAQNNETPFFLLKNKNAIHVNSFIMSNNRLMSTIYTCYVIQKHVQKLDIVSNLESVNILMGKYIRDIYQYKTVSTDNTSLNRLLANPDFVSELESNAKLLNLGDTKIMYKVKALDEYFKGVEILRQIEWNTANLPLIVDLLKTKNKKVNYKYYNRTTELQKLKEIINTPWIGGLIERPYEDLTQYNSQKPKAISL